MLTLWLAVGPVRSHAMEKPVSKSPKVVLKAAASAKVPKWKLQKEARERYQKAAAPFVGKFIRNPEGEYFEFYFSKKGMLKGMACGVGEYDYRFALTDVEVLSPEELRFKLKGKLCTARLLDDALIVTYHTGIKKYHPRAVEPLITKR